MSLSQVDSDADTSFVMPTQWTATESFVPRDIPVHRKATDTEPARVMPAPAIMPAPLNAAHVPVDDDDGGVAAMDVEDDPPAPVVWPASAVVSRHVSSMPSAPAALPAPPNTQADSGSAEDDIDLLQWISDVVGILPPAEASAVQAPEHTEKATPVAGASHVSESHNHGGDAYDEEEDAVIRESIELSLELIRQIDEENAAAAAAAAAAATPVAAHVAAPVAAGVERAAHAEEKDDGSRLRQAQLHGLLTQRASTTGDNASAMTDSPAVSAEGVPLTHRVTAGSAMSAPSHTTHAPVSTPVPDGADDDEIDPEEVRLLMEYALAQ
jgi:hypothetical protein